MPKELNRPKKKQFLPRPPKRTKKKPTHLRRRPTNPMLDRLNEQAIRLSKLPAFLTIRSGLLIMACLISMAVYHFSGGEWHTSMYSALLFRGVELEVVSIIAVAHLMVRMLILIGLTFLLLLWTMGRRAHAARLLALKNLKPVPVPVDATALPQTLTPKKEV